MWSWPTMKADMVLDAQCFDKAHRRPVSQRARRWPAASCPAGAALVREAAVVHRHAVTRNPRTGRFPADAHLGIDVCEGLLFSAK